MCGWAEFPLLPTRPMTWPFVTSSPTSTVGEPCSRWFDIAETPLPRSRR